MQTPCRICTLPQPELHLAIQRLRDEGAGYKRIWKVVNPIYGVSREEVQRHCSHVERTVLTAIGEAIDSGVEVPADWFSTRGIELPQDGTKWVAATVEERGPNGEKHWVRIKPEEDEPEAERVEIRQAQPVVVEGRISVPFIYTPSNWQTWIATPDAQFGYWVDSAGKWHTIHDETALSCVHQVAQEVAEADGLHGWLDVGDFMDLAAPSRHNPTAIDLHVNGLNLSTSRASEELARRRFVVGPDGELIIMGGNHDLRFAKKAAQDMPYLVGLRRAGDAEDEHPMLSVPYLVRAKDYGVEWVSSYPAVYRALNDNLVAVHAPAYGSKALDTARKIAARIRVSVVFGHIHRREALAENIETRRGTRTLELWSDGTLARLDGSLPGHESTYDNNMNRVIASTLPDNQGFLAPNMQQGFSIIHVEKGDRNRFSVERVAIWNGWCSWRGVPFFAACDVEGNPLPEEPVVAA